MGSGSSKISGDNFLLTRSRQDLLKMTANTRTFIDYIFIYLKNELQIKSYINLLGSQASCEKFIFLLEDDLKKIFERLPVNIGKDKKGVLVFQRIDDIIKKEDSKQYTYTYCQYVARFVTRFFQIYAALALSVMDNDAVLDMGADSSMQAGILAARPERRLGFRYELPRQGQRGGETETHIIEQHGGDYDRTYIETTNFIFKKLKKGVRQFTENQWYESDIGLKFKIITFKPKISELPFNIQFEYEGKTFKMLILFYSSIGSQYYKYNIISLSIDNNQVSTAQKFYGLTSNISRTTPDQYVLSGFRNLIEEFIEANENYLERQYKIGRRPDQRQGVAGRDGDYTRSTQIDAYATIAGEINGKPLPRPTPHCVTRALQLIAITPGVANPRTAICKKTFMNLTAGQTSLGITELIKLFFDVQKKEGAAAIDNEYKNKLLEAFPGGKLKETGCKKDGVMYIKAESKDHINKAAEAARAMWKYQGEHTALVGKLMLTLFNVHKDKSGQWVVEGIHPKIYEGGIDILESRITPIVREVLVGYYSKCELLYQEARNLLSSHLLQ